MTTRVKDVRYRDGDDTYPYDTEESKYQMDALEVEFACPICETVHVHSLSPSVDTDERVTCPKCQNQYYLLPYFGYKQEAFQDQVEEQLAIINDVYPTVSKHRGDLYRMTALPIFFMLGATGVVAGTTTSVVLLASVLNRTTLDVVGIIGFSLLFGALFVGIIATLQSVAEVVQFVVAYREAETDRSVVGFFYAICNYYHQNPYKTA